MLVVGERIEDKTDFEYTFKNGKHSTTVDLHYLLSSLFFYTDSMG